MCLVYTPHAYIENESEASKHPGTAGSNPRLRFLPSDAFCTEKEHQGIRTYYI